jgi:hypothetical protein
MGNNTGRHISAGLLHIGGGGFAEDVRTQLVSRNASIGRLFDGPAAFGGYLKAPGTPVPHQALRGMDQLAKCGLTTGDIDGFSDRLGVHVADTSLASVGNTSPASGGPVSLLIAFLV